MEKVIVAITTYNLENYIAQALDSVLIQKTNFPFKVIVADDCSTDGTVAIIESYVNKFPGKVQLLTTDKNLGSLANSNRLFNKIDCEYFSFLDGDDYWLTEDRLQRQVDFLDSHLEYSMCGGNTYYLRNDELAEAMVAQDDLGRSYTFEDYMNGTMPFIHTSSLLVRNTIFAHGLPPVFHKVVGTFEECALRGEDFRRLLHLKNAPAYIMNDFFSVYRIHQNGIWQGSTQTKRMLEWSISDRFYSKFFGEQYQYFIKRSKQSYKALLRYLVSEGLLYPEYRLNDKESFLYLGYLNDCGKNKSSNNTRHISLVKKYLAKLLLR